MFYKINRLVGYYNAISDERKISLANEIFSVFIQCMEYNPAIGKSNSAVSHLYEGTKKPEAEFKLNVVDMKNAEDILLIAIEFLYETKNFDWTILNPINFKMISMLELGSRFFEESERIANWLMKLYTKLGMISQALA